MSEANQGRKMCHTISGFPVSPPAPASLPPPGFHSVIMFTDFELPPSIYPLSLSPSLSEMFKKIVAVLKEY